ncbi:Uncharacterized protein GBIM_11637 [Gryllus bimaculatus]|nr:Uncharacterized protein GBIM_11637 [Gryllus bimaculatus]
MISNKLLAKIAIYTGVFGTSGSLYLFYKVQNGLKSSPYMIESMQLLQEHKGAVEYLGKPLKYGYLNLNSEHNFCDGYKAEFEVPVKGSVNSGSLYLKAKRESPQQEWDVYLVEFSPANSSKRLVVKRLE